MWKETLKLHANDGLYSAKNVLLQVTDRWRRGSVEGKMGEIIIPVSTFFTEATLTGCWLYLFILNMKSIDKL